MSVLKYTYVAASIDSCSSYLASYVMDNTSSLTDSYISFVRIVKGGLVFHVAIHIHSYILISVYNSDFICKYLEIHSVKFACFSLLLIKLE